MATQSQGIKQLMAAEKEAAQVVANSRKSEWKGRSFTERKSASWLNATRGCMVSRGGGLAELAGMKH